MKDRELLQYYALRAQEYERIYAKPERQDALTHLKTHLADLLAGHDVLEIACGTGYWTHHMASHVRSLLATDAVPDVLEVARSKSYPEGRVRFAQDDAFNPGPFADAFTAGMAGFWWSHVLKQDLPGFLHAFHCALQPGALVVFFDNLYVEGSSTPISETDNAGNTYQNRLLADGSDHLVLKNFPSEKELRQAVAATATDLTITTSTYYWCLSYRIAG